MKKFSDLIKESERKSGNKLCPSFSLITSGPYDNETRGDIPALKGIYFGFEFNKAMSEEGILVFKRLIYVGKATADNNLRKRIGEHYTQHDLKYRETGEKVDMDTIAFFVCEMDNDDVISDIEAAQIYKQRPPANDIGIENYVGKTTPLLVSVSNGFKFVDDDLFMNPVIIRTEDKKE